MLFERDIYTDLLAASMRSEQPPTATELSDEQVAMVRATSERNRARMTNG